LEWSTAVLVGMSWPKSDEDKMIALGKIFKAFQKDIANLPDQIARALANMHNVGKGPGVDAATDFLAQISGGAESLFPDLNKALDDFAANAEEFGMEVQYAKMMIIVMSAQMLY